MILNNKKGDQHLNLLKNNCPVTPILYKKNINKMDSSLTILIHLIFEY